MDDRELRRGIQNAWILVALLVLSVAVWTVFTFWNNSDEVPAQFSQGNRPFVPGSSNYGIADPPAGEVP